MARRRHLWISFARRSIVALVLIIILVHAHDIQAGQAPFTEEAVARGVTYPVAPDDPLSEFDPFGAGLAFVDLDNDGDEDFVMVGRVDGLVGVYENDGTGQFTDRSGMVGMPTIIRYSGVTAADYDADGDLDLFFSSYLDRNVLMRNDGNFQFTDKSAESRLDDAGPAMGCTWGDVDGDGWLDLFVPNRTGVQNDMTPNRMYINDRQGSFDEVGETLGVGQSMDPTLVAAFMDFDRDGDADLYIGNDKGSGPKFQNHLFENQGDSTFVDITAATNTAANVDCMGIAIGDLTHNGWQDLYVTNISLGNVLLLNPGGAPCVDGTATANVGSFEIGWATFFIDFDNDTWEELYVCNILAENRLYNYDGTWPTTDMASALGVNDSANSYCAAFADVDGDGDQDIAVSSTGANVRLYINNEGHLRNWIRFRIDGEGANKFAVGAQIDVCVAGECQMREIFNGSNYKSQNEFVVHFGLDTATMVDEVHVRWPSGSEVTLNNLAANQIHNIGPPPPPVPAASEWGVIVLSLLLVTCGSIVFRQPTTMGLLDY